MPRRKALYSLRRPRCRPSWNKYNLFNMNRVNLGLKPSATFYQQKWAAKAHTRTYHGDTLSEKKWRHMFRPDSRSVVQQDARDLADDDGSRFSSGRGSGSTQLPEGHQNRMAKPKSVPYMNMVYHQLERRLDVAIWRALFASSTRQARQFCTHGGVKVNGKKMVHPGYLLNPGDMFQVEPERVLFATGDRKDYWERRYGRQDRKRGYSIDREPKSTRDGDSEVKPSEVESTETAASTETATATASEQKDATPSPKDRLQSLMSAAKDMLKEGDTEDINASRKKALREFVRIVRKELGVKTSWETPVKDQIVEMASKLSIEDSGAVADKSVDTVATNQPEDQTQPGNTTQTMAEFEKKILSQALEAYKENPLDYTKGYKTPWQPRPFMSPFAFIPRYLEVHAPICSAVYLRHPVAKAGYSEIPSPFPESTNRLAFNWYLRRR